MAAARSGKRRVCSVPARLTSQTPFLFAREPGGRGQLGLVILVGDHPPTVVLLIVQPTRAVGRAISFGCITVIQGKPGSIATEVYRSFHASQVPQ